MENKKNNSSKKSNSTKKTSTSTKKPIAKKSSSSASKNAKTAVSAAKKTTFTVKKATPKTVTSSKSVKKNTSNIDLKKKREEEKPKVDLIKIEKTSKKDFNFIKYILYAVGVFFIALGVLFNNALLETKIFGIILGDLSVYSKLIGILLLGVTGVIQAIKSEKNSLIKSILIILGVVFVSTWIFPGGQFSGSEFVPAEAYGLNFNSLVTVAYNAIYVCIDKILMLIVIAAFYKIISMTGAYHAIIKKITKPFVGKEKNFAIAVAALVIILTSFISETYVVLIFLPFLISMLAVLKVDKLTAFATTFGALIAGTIASPYGTEALIGFNHYAALEPAETLMVRVVLQLVVFVLFVIFVNLRLASNKCNEAVVDLLVDENSNKKTKILPLALILGITGIFLILGYVNWYANFEIETFVKFHEWLYTLNIGEYPIMEMLFGTSDKVSVIGAFTIFDGITTLIVMSLLVIAAYRIKLDQLAEVMTKSIKFMAKPLLVIVLISSLFTIANITQFYSVIGHSILSLTDGFNPYTSSIVAALSSVFSNDLAFTSFVFSGYFTSEFSESTNVFSLAYTSMHGLMQLVIPTSPLLIGLYYTNNSYKSWVKYIAVFFGSILIVTLLLLTVLTYMA